MQVLRNLMSDCSHLEEVKIFLFMTRPQLAHNCTKRNKIIRATVTSALLTALIV